MATDAAVLVVCNYNGKKRNHLDPLARAGASVTVVSATGPVAGDEFDHVVLPAVARGALQIPALGLYALVLAVRREFDLVASISLFPYGLLALLAGRASGTPTHLAVIGSDLDVHARARYGVVVRFLFRQFSVVSVTGDTYVSQLADAGVDSGSVTTLTNSIPLDQFRGSRRGDPDFDYVWVGKFVDAKNPASFVDAMAELQEADEGPSGVMLGDGPHLSRVRDRLSEAGLEDSVTLAGWVDDPDVYLDRASIYVSTSSRDALPLTLLEAMAAGLVPVAPRIGAIPEVVHHGQNGFLYPAGDTEGLVRVLEWIDSGVDVEAVGERARETASRYGYDAAASDWERIIWLASRESDATPTTSLDSETP